jgi:hypothetical protein
LTAVGPITLERTYLRCSTCEQGEFGADGVLGIDGYVTLGACRMACLLGVQQSFARAEVALAEVAGWKLDDNTIRRLCHAVAAVASSSRETRSTTDAFSRAEGDFELQIDAGKVNTFEGWRDVKVAVFGRRKRADDGPRLEPANLPTPAVRSVVAAVEKASQFGERCKR